MIEIQFIKEENRAIACDNNKQIGECDFIEEKEYWKIVQTEVERSYQSQKKKKKLVDIIIENAKKENKKLNADCSYAKKIIERYK